MANNFAMTILLIVLGLSGKAEMAAEVGIIQGATVALFFSFSANARSLILNENSKISAQSFMASRLVLLIPIAGFAYLLSVSTAGVDRSVAIILIVRRCVEWLGEVHLCEMERIDRSDFAKKYLISQVCLLLFALFWLLGDFPFPTIGLIFWALTPLMLSYKFIWESFASIVGVFSVITIGILPHIGSTAIISMAVYVFRLLVLLLIGKEAAGDMYTAFAIGGLSGGVFANALGPSIVLHEQRSGKKHFPSIINFALFVSLMLGVIILLLSTFQFSFFGWTGKSNLFWSATGISLVGGVVMVFSQRLRLKILQNSENGDVFGQDVFINILVIASVPFVYYMFGVKSMISLYFISSVISYIIYKNTKHYEIPKYIIPIIAVMLVTPIFFQINNGIFRETAVYFSSEGRLSFLPLPFSLIGCFAGIVLLSEYKKSSLSFFTIFLIYSFMSVASIISTQNNIDQQNAKFILLIQYILPFFALVLGQSFSSSNVHSDKRILEKSFVVVLCVVAPVQLLITWYNGYLFLQPSLYLFSIYQALQYVPVILVGALLVSIFSLWKNARYRIVLSFLILVFSVYVAASMSILAIGMFMIGIFIFAIINYVTYRDILPCFIIIVALVMLFSYISVQRNVIDYKFKIFDIKELSAISNYDQENMAKLAPNVSERIVHWKYYSSNIISSTKVFLFGNEIIPDRKIHPSAHNYYMDLIFNFGILPFLPLFALLVYTITLIVKNYRYIIVDHSLLGICFVAIFLLLVDNSFKVSLRQPYSGIFTFFLWGVLITKLRCISKDVSCLSSY